MTIMSNRNLSAIAIAFLCNIGLTTIFDGDRAEAQTATTTNQQQVNLNQVLQALNGLGGLGGLGGLIGGGSTTGTNTGTTTGGTTTGGTTTGGSTTGGTTGGTEQAPSIVQNQFTTTSTGALHQRAPGLFIRQAIALQNGDLELSGTPAPVEPNFLRDTANQVALAIIDSFQNILDTLNTAIGALGGLSTTGGTGTSTISNPTTTGAGTTTPIQ